ncbi:hypothetical protein AVEN_225460-1 [Araneus ventricosus]|uniref:Transposable element Tc1 transposase n=1 Tax=Araneus ventricosus TaxID=182803 RepID=A0A4Y2UK78_ARAVE|nr:hypothetical protein AVEN_225460-1 [Araneus ventricosus]
MLNKPETYWNNVLFADESKFNIFGSDRRIMVWRRKNEELNPENLVGTVKYGGGGILVWGCISAPGLATTVSKYVPVLWFNRSVINTAGLWLLAIDSSQYAGFCGFSYRRVTNTCRSLCAFRLHRSSNTCRLCAFSYWTVKKYELSDFVALAEDQWQIRAWILWF